jgi:hypothetical protein
VAQAITGETPDRYSYQQEATMVMKALTLAALLMAAFAAPASAQELNCSNFDSQAEAQAELRRNPADPNGLDGPEGADNDTTGTPGVACENLPGPFDTRPVVVGPPDPTPAPTEEPEPTDPEPREIVKPVVTPDIPTGTGKAGGGFGASGAVPVAPLAAVALLLATYGATRRRG